MKEAAQLDSLAVTGALNIVEARNRRKHRLIAKILNGVCPKMSRKPKSQTVVASPEVPTAAPAVSVAVPPLAVGIVDAARLIGVPPFSIREAVGNGSLAAKKVGRHYIIKVADLEGWIDSLDAVPPIPCFVKRAEARKEAA